MEPKGTRRDREMLKENTNKRHSTKTTRNTRRNIPRTIRQPTTTKKIQRQTKNKTTRTSPDKTKLNSSSTT